ncbi:MAG: helix-turn-helix transcriptional regulator [Lachnospiraceae bacterium]|nr:helix-turn-helix transcriptional regulator [Lachnospiraceae bacterium]
MTVSEKMKYYRKMRGISQEMLGELSGINSATIKKYEYGIRNPKPDQLLKIAGALGISIYQFMDFDIETTSDVLTLLFQLDEQIDMNFEMKKDRKGNPVPSSIKISFDNADINERLAKYIKAKGLCDSVIADASGYASAEEHEAAIADIQADVAEIKNHLIDSSRIVKKGTQGNIFKLNTIGEE